MKTKIKTHSQYMRWFLFYYNMTSYEVFILWVADVGDLLDETNLEITRIGRSSCSLPQEMSFAYQIKAT